MGVSVLRVAVCSAMFAGALILGGSAVAPALAEPVGVGQTGTDDETSKDVNTSGAGLPHVIRRIFGEHHVRIGTREGSAPEVKVGSDPVGGFDGNKSRKTTFAGADAKSTPNGQRDTGAGGTAGTDSTGGAESVDIAPEPVADTGGSNYIDKTTPEYFVTELGRAAGDWWNIGTTFVRRVVTVLLPTPHNQDSGPAPAFRGPAPLEPVIDSSGGAVGNDYQATGFDNAPVLQAPVIAAPMPAGAVRFPLGAPALASSPGVGSALVRGAGNEVSSNTATRPGASSEPSPGATSGMSGATARRGYTDYLRAPGLPQLVGAALPGVAGILLMTAGGAVIGYRQASAGRTVRTSAAARYLP
jgi:hypothetical protein